MNRAIAAGAVLLLGAAAFAMRPPKERIIVRERRVEVPVRIEVPVERLVPVFVERERAEAPVPERRADPAPAAQDDAALPREKVVFLFERELSLEPWQRAHAEQVLRERGREVEAYHREVRASGVFVAREYERRVAAIQSASYARIGEVLDGPQYRRFAELLAQGRLGDAVVFEIDTGMAVVE